MKQQSKFKALIVGGLKTAVIPLGLWLLFAVLSHGRTASLNMLRTMMRQSVLPTIISYSLLLTFSMGMLNFSAGGMILFAGVIGGNLAMMTGTGIPGLVVFCLIVCALEGALTGVLYNAMRVPCMVLTVGMMIVWESAPKAIYPNGLNMSASMTYLARSPYCFIVLGIMAVAFHIIYNKTAFGHNIRAVGNNQAVANSVGLDSDKIKFAAFVLSSIFMGVAAILYVSERGEVRNVSAMGSWLIMADGFMAMFFGMFLAQYCNMSVAAILGTLSTKILTNGFVAMGLSATVRDIAQGLLLLILLIIAANPGFFEHRKADKIFALQCNEELQKS